MLPDDRIVVANLAGIQQVPHIGFMVTPNTVDTFLTMAEGPSVNNKVREGIVMKSVSRPGVSFKAISNTFLLKGGE